MPRWSSSTKTKEENSGRPTDRSRKINFSKKSGTKYFVFLKAGFMANLATLQFPLFEEFTGHKIE